VKQFVTLGRVAGAFGLVPPAGLFFLAHAHMLPAWFVGHLSLLVTLFLAVEVAAAVALVAKLAQMVRRDRGTTWRPERPARTERRSKQVRALPAADVTPARPVLAIESAERRAIDPVLAIAAEILERRDEVQR
jgi:hypothetical protein